MTVRFHLCPHSSVSGPLSDDFAAMLERANAAGVKSMIITGTSLSESREAIKLAQEHGLYATIGCHPTRSAEFDKFRGGPDAYLAALDKLISQNLTGRGRVVAIGECGLGALADVLFSWVLMTL